MKFIGNAIHRRVEVCFTMCGDLTWRVSDCEELEGFLTKNRVLIHLAGMKNKFEKVI